MKTIQVRHAGHYWRSKDRLISGILLWTLSHRQAKAGWLAKTYIQQLCADTGCSLEDLPEATKNREGWKGEDQGDLCWRRNMMLMMMMMITGLFIYESVFNSSFTCWSLFLPSLYQSILQSTFSLCVLFLFFNFSFLSIYSLFSHSFFLSFFLLFTWIISSVITTMEFLITLE